MEPSLLCGSESWPAIGKEISRIDAAEMKCSDGLQGKEYETASMIKE
jgi:hypothetical protein